MLIFCLELPDWQLCAAVICSHLAKLIVKRLIQGFDVYVPNSGLRDHPQSALPASTTVVRLASLEVSFNSDRTFFGLNQQILFFSTADLSSRKNLRGFLDTNTGRYG